jgi:DNA-binding transcriptional LysR family regulator
MRPGGRAGAPPGGAVEEVGVEAVLQAEQYLRRLAALPAPGDMAEVVEAFDAQIDVACAAAGLARRTVCEVQNMQYLTELVQHGAGISVLPPMSVRAITAHLTVIRITPPIRRDICAVVAARHAPTAAQALLDILKADINDQPSNALGHPFSA